jgi:hypothetical protein
MHVYTVMVRSQFRPYAMSYLGFLNTPSLKYVICAYVIAVIAIILWRAA